MQPVTKTIFETLRDNCLAQFTISAKAAEYMGTFIVEVEGVKELCN